MSDIDTADEVFHEPTGETWLVAYVDGKRLAYCGWPSGIAELKDCTLTRKATLQERLALLASMAAMDYGSDHRAVFARSALTREIGA